MLKMLAAENVLPPGFSDSSGPFPGNFNSRSSVQIISHPSEKQTAPRPG